MKKLKFETKEVEMPKGMINKIKRFLGLPHKTVTYVIYKFECENF